MTNNAHATHRQLSAQLHANPGGIGMEMVVDDFKGTRAPSLHLFPVIERGGHTATHLDIVLHEWEELVSQDDAEEVVQSFLDDMLGDFQALIAGGLAATTVAYAKARVSGGDWTPVARDVVDDGEGGFTVTDTNDKEGN